MAAPLSGGSFRAHTNVVYKRNSFGRFASECDMAANSTTRKLIEQGARISRGMAPSGPKGSYTKKPGYIPLKRSIKTQMVSRTSGYWYSIAPHAMHVEFGTSAHTIRGKLRFFWTKKGRWFNWNDPRFGPEEGGGEGHFGYTNWNYIDGAMVRHPGTRAQPFLRPAYDRVSAIAMKVAREEFPG